MCEHARSPAAPRQGELPAGAAPFYKLPVFTYHHARAPRPMLGAVRSAPALPPEPILTASARLQGALSAALKRTYYELAQRHAGVPRLSALQREALAAVGALALGDELRLDLALRPGDLQLLNNRALLHTRSAYTDAEVITRARLTGGSVGRRGGVAAPRACLHTVESTGSAECGAGGG